MSQRNENESQDGNNARIQLRTDYKLIRFKRFENESIRVNLKIDWTQ